MDESNSDGDLSMSPSQILGRLQVLRQLQLLQRGKLQKQQLLYQDSPEISANITELVSHFSNSTSYNTFQNLLQTHDTSNESSPRPYISNSSRKLFERDLIEGVSELNISRESEFLINSPTSIKSKVLSENELRNSHLNHSAEKSRPNKQISLDEILILTPKKNFEALVVEKLQAEENIKENKVKQKSMENGKKSFLKRGEGMSRFGLNKNNLIIQHTKSLPWLRKKQENKTENLQISKKGKSTGSKNLEKIDVQIIVSRPSSPVKKNIVDKIQEPEKCLEQSVHIEAKKLNTSSNNKSPIVKTGQKIINLPKGKHPLKANKGKTWAALLTKEQDDFLRQLKQSEYYKNFASPSKSITSEMSYDDNMDKIQQDKESSEQKIFELLEHKVTHESFNLENSFINRFLRRNKAECSGESTPLVMQKCLSNNPDLMHINSNLRHERSENEDYEQGSCRSECTECVETCSISSCCSCVTVEPANSSCPCQNGGRSNCKIQNYKGDRTKMKKVNSENVSDKKDETDVKSNNDNATDDSNKIKADMVEMNNKLIATSELLKERLNELEDEIETFRKENANLTKMREEIDSERHKFLEEKATFEQKFHEEKVLSEYYIAEEKEKLTKQRQLYERHVRDMRGRLNKKDKDEVVALKKEINDLKEDIRLKDAKSTSMIARLRNQLKIMEKEKKDLQEEVEKLKKENRRIQHSNDVTRRLTNLKYLEQINKKLTNITSKDSKSEVNIEPNIKYKAFEIERQSRNRRVQSQNKGLGARAKSVPNLKITSRYAKYFSQKDSLSEIERRNTINVDGFCTSPSDHKADNDHIEELEYSNCSEKSATDSEDENNLEKLYDERFRNAAPTSKKSSLTNSSDDSNFNDNNSSYFIHKSNSSQHSLPIHQINLNDKISLATKSNNFNRNQKGTRKSPTNYSGSSHESGDYVLNYSKDSGKKLGINSHQPLLSSHKTPLSSISNHSSSQKQTTVIDQYQDPRIIVTPEPCTSKSSLSKTNLNPTEITKPDGSRELRFPNGNVKFISADGKYSKFVYYNGDVKENFYNEGRMKYFYAETKTFQTTHADGLEILEFPDGQVEKRYKDGSSEIRLPNGSVRYFDPKNVHVREEWRFPDGAALSVAANGEQRVVFSNGQVEVHNKEHKRREFPDGTVKFVYNDGTSETRYASGRVRIKDKHGNLIMDSAPS